MTKSGGKNSQLERMQASKQRSEMLLHNIRLNRVVNVLKHDKPELYAFEQELIDKGKLDPIQVTPAKKPMPAIMDGAVTDNGPRNDPDDSEAEMDDDDAFNRNVSSFGDLAFTTLSRAFRKSNKSIFTKANVKSLQLRGQRQTSLKKMLEILEFLSDIMPEDKIDKQHRTKRSVIQLICEAIAAKGDRSSGVIMPIKYNQCGPYGMIMHDREVVVKSRWTGKTVTIAVPRGSKPYFDQEHSTMRCKVKLEGNSTFDKLVYPYFAKAEASVEMSPGTAVAAITNKVTNAAAKAPHRVLPTFVRRRVYRKQCPGGRAFVSPPCKTTTFGAMTPAGKGKGEGVILAKKRIREDVAEFKDEELLIFDSPEGSPSKKPKSQEDERTGKAGANAGANSSHVEPSFGKAMLRSVAHNSSINLQSLPKLLFIMNNMFFTGSCIKSICPFCRPQR